MKNNPGKNENRLAPKKRSTNTEVKKDDLTDHKYPKPTENDQQFKNQPEFIEPEPNKKSRDL